MFKISKILAIFKISKTSDIRYQILLNVELISSMIKHSEEAAQTKAKQKKKTAV